MNIGLLVSELEDREVKKICIGACQAAKDKDVTLVIMPGKYLVGDNSDVEDKDFVLQQSAVFEYANSSDFDALIVDAERIGSKTTILKKEAFLKKYENIPVITLTEQEGFPNVNPVQSENYKYEQLGYEAVCDAAFYVKNQVIPPAESQKQFSYVEVSDQEAIRILSQLGSRLLHRKYDSEKAYEEFTKLAIDYGINNCGVFTYNKKARNTLKYPWERPAEINMKSVVINGREMEFGSESMSVDTGKIISNFTKDSSKILIMGTLFVGDYQLGVLVSEFTPGFLIDYYFDSVTSLATGISRLSYLEKSLDKTLEELYEVQEELARDDSVLDHIGDQDYLTGGLNRRGFFAKAYDLLKEKFEPGTNAVVAYIHMESLKRINDMYGHEEGDRAVKKIAGILEEVFSGCIYGRIRGDEFAVLVITDDDGKAETLRQEMSNQNARLLAESNRYINHLQYSICEFGHDENLSLREMLKETDENLQRIKGNL
ncbi:MAG: GGDEF domain-containing protein [Butyrivibrio sp.]|nr:GGDEF domain-containing protein [Butyrivibrio sp.]